MDASFITSDVLPPVKQGDSVEVDALTSTFMLSLSYWISKREWWSSDEHIIITPLFPLIY
jgi:hypothetical protein